MSTRINYASGSDLKAGADLIQRYWEQVHPTPAEGPRSAGGQITLNVPELHWLANSSLLGGGLLVLKVEGVVRGLVGWRRRSEDPDRALVVALCVDPGAWEGGGFEVLLEAVSREAVRAGCSELDLWLEASKSPARPAAESLGFVRTEDQRALGVIASGREGASIEATRYARTLPGLGLAAETLRLALPRLGFLFVLALPLALAGAWSEGSLRPLAILGLPLGVLAPSLAEVYARGRDSMSGIAYGLVCAGLSALLGVVGVLHVVAFVEGVPLWSGAKALFEEPGYALLGAHWAPLWLVTGALSARSLGGTSQRWLAFLAGNALFLTPCVLGFLLFQVPILELLGLWFGLLACALPVCWGTGALVVFAFWISDDLRDRFGRSLEFHFEPDSSAAEAGPSAS